MAGARLETAGAGPSHSPGEGFKILNHTLGNLGLKRALSVGAYEKTSSNDGDDITLMDLLKQPFPS